MGRIQSSTGLITGIEIEDTVNKLMAIQSRPRDAIIARQKVASAEQAAIGDLTALVLGVQFAARRLQPTDLFAQKKVTSSQPTLLTATAGAAASNGQFKFVPVQLAQTHQAISSGLASRDTALGAGSLTIRQGGHVDTAVNLSDLNAGAGVSRGKIKIIDRSGVSSVIDLNYAQTIDDVVQAINSAEDGSVSASIFGDRLVLRDNSGGEGNLRVLEVGSGTTAADLGLAGINVDADSATGGDLVELFSNISLSQLREGAGFSLRAELAELDVSFRDGTTLQIDLDPADEDAPQTLDDLLDRLNAADPARLQAAISADGKRLELTDLTTGTDPFTVASALGGSVAEELGFTNAASGDTITGSRLVSGLKTTLLNSLSGGSGLGTLGLLDLTDRSGATASVNLASAETLDDVIAAINAAGLDLTAAYNGPRTGLVITDSSGSTTSNLIVANGDVTNTATKLGLAGNVAANSLDSGPLHRQVVSRNTLLSSYNSGEGVRNGSFLITDSDGQTGAVNLTVLEPETIGDVIDAINALSIDVEARINDAGDGIVLIDSAGGAETLTVAESGTGHAAADLHILGEATANTIDGSTATTITLDADDTLEDLVEKINATVAGATASILTDGTGSLRHHLVLASDRSGRAGELQIDGSGLDLKFEDLATAQDAVLQIGTGTAASLTTSATSQFTGVLPGLDVTLVDSSLNPVTVTVSSTVDSVATSLQIFVDNYNKLRDKLDTYTAFDPVAGTKGTLFGSSQTLRIDSELSRLITGRFFNDGSIRSLGELGIAIDDEGQLSLDRTKLQAKFESDQEGVVEFFTDEERGFAAKADALLETIVGRDNSLLVNRIETLQKQIETFTGRIAGWNIRLDLSRQRLTNQFFKLEEVVARIQNNLNAISQIQFISPIQT